MEMDAPLDERMKRAQPVLVADDNPVNCEVARRHLERLGFRVDLAADGREAVEKARAGSYALVIMDCRMPELDGSEAARAIRAEARLANLPIIAVSAHAGAAERQKCLAAGMNAYLEKPFRARDLERVVFQCLDDLPVP
jgi:CheY-like chemotaxis protein